MATLITKNSSTASSVPTAAQLVQGELAVNVTDKRLFTENSSGTVVELGTNPSSLTLPNGTVNGLAFLNASKVLTTGSALTFDGSKLTVTSSGEQIKLTSSGDFSSTGTGFLRFYDSVGAKGYVGYGGTASRFDINTGSSMNLNMNAVGGTMTFQISNTEQMRLTSTGLGIGTSSPSSWNTKLVVYNSQLTVTGGGYDGSFADSIYFGGNSEGTTYRNKISNSLSSTTTNQMMKFSIANGASTWVDVMTLNGAGNVGIGTTSPVNKLVVSNAGAVGAETRLVHGDGSTAGASFLSYNRSGAAFVPLEISGSYLKFSISDVERARIDSSGNLLVGTTSTSLTSGGFRAVPANGGAGSTAIGIGHITGSASGDVYASFAYAGTTIGSITQNGTTAVAYNTSSDYRLKENIQPMTGALAKVAQLKPCTYNWKADGSAGEGFIAHELQAVVPQCVTGEKDAVDAEGKPVYQGIDTSFLVATLTAALQELKAELDSVKSELAQLKGN